MKWLATVVSCPEAGLAALVIAVTAASNLVFADCADKKVRNPSPCVTQFTVCAWNNGNCAGNGTQPAFGPFQCDLAANGKYCHGDNNFALCKTTAPCQATGAQQLGGVCRMNPNLLQQFNAETQTTDDCP